LVCGALAFSCALIGGLTAVFSNNEASLAEGLLAVIVAVFWVVLIIIVSRLGREGRVVVFITALAANSWVAGWYAIKVVRKARRSEGTHRARETPHITPEMERVARARFVTKATSERKEAVRAEPQEPPGPA
jgi:hypothetical protein